MNSVWKGCFQLKKRSFLVHFSVCLEPSKRAEPVAWNAEASTSSPPLHICHNLLLCFSLRRCHHLSQTVCCPHLLVLQVLAHLSLQIFPNRSRSHTQKTQFQPPRANIFLTWEGFTETHSILCALKKPNEEINELPLHRHNMPASGAVPGAQYTAASLFSPLR